MSYVKTASGDFMIGCIEGAMFGFTRFQLVNGIILTSEVFNGPFPAKCAGIKALDSNNYQALIYDTFFGDA